MADQALLQLGEPIVLNPKRERGSPYGRAGWYPYYASFSHAFARSVISSVGPPPGSRILDPWNGSGTTVAAALAEGHHGIGFDINPVMVIAAKAALLSYLSKESLGPLLAEILSKAAKSALPAINREDPLSVWLNAESCESVRRIEASIQHLLVKPNSHALMSLPEAVDGLSDLASFFYVALFRTLRKLLSEFFASNPTWVKKPGSGRERLRPSFKTLVTLFAAEVLWMMSTLQPEAGSLSKCGMFEVAVAPSERLPQLDGAVDCVITSPPYCTRIDYAVATSIELALLGVGPFAEMDRLRRSMMGTSMVSATPPDPSPLWGATCLNLISDIAKHPSKASAGYYLKNHLQYFDALFKSVREISRVLRREAICVLVVQDSHYKEIRNDLASICIEMGESSGLSFERRIDFEHTSTRANVNPRSKRYRFSSRALESVLFLRRKAQGGLKG